MLKSKYGLDSQILVKRRSMSDSTWWKDLADVCGIGVGNQWFDKNVVWKVGDEKYSEAFGKN